MTNEPDRMRRLVAIADQLESGCGLICDGAYVSEVDFSRQPGDYTVIQRKPRHFLPNEFHSLVGRVVRRKEKPLLATMIVGYTDAALLLNGTNGSHIAPRHLLEDFTFDDDSRSLCGVLEDLPPIPSPSPKPPRRSRRTRQPDTK